MVKHLHKSIEGLEKLLLTMGGMVEEAIAKAGLGLQQRRIGVCEQVVEEDDIIDDRELMIDDACLKLLALYQPVAEDLRFVTSVMKINNDLERVADLAANTAERAKKLAQAAPIKVPEQFLQMNRMIIQMLREGLKAFIERDAIMARAVLKRDDQVDQWHHEILTEMIATMKKEPEKIDLAVQLLWISRNSERIADHITNIAEDVVYMVEGETIRHQALDLSSNVYSLKKLDSKDTDPNTPTTESK